MKHERMEENVSIAMDKYDRRPSAWFRDSFGLLGKYGKISKDQFIRASVDIGVGAILISLDYIYGVQRKEYCRP